ncbi:MAG: flagellar biosynthesis protein FlhF [Gammaproteobacteria bacterium]|nr:flagellar biosynthesis protein FlhF [Gammaproteobacteria bacterium]
MKIRRFFAPDMRRAIQQVRNEQGADAVILSSRAVDGGVEIVSAVDYDHELVAQMTRPAAPAATHEREPEAGAAEAAQPADAGRTDASEDADGTVSSNGADGTVSLNGADGTVSFRNADAASFGAEPADDVDAAARGARPQRQAADEPGLAALRLELQAMKCMLREQLAQLSWADLKRLEPERALLSTRVARLGLDPELSATLVAEVENPKSSRAWREVVFGIARRLSVPREDPLDNGGVFALVGPTGVGKTTTIAKLAARHCMRYGPDSIALISTDTLRVGAQRQLDAFAAILGVPVRTASNGEELGRLLHALRSRRLVLIDTAGMAPRDRRLAESMQQLESVRSIRRYLVLAANMQPGAMDDAVRAFGAENLAGAVLTKLDEVSGLGAALSVLIRQRLKIAWLSHGQRVPEDLRLASGMHLLRWAFEREHAAEADTFAAPRRRSRRGKKGAAHAAV